MDEHSYGCLKVQMLRESLLLGDMIVCQSTSKFVLLVDYQSMLAFICLVMLGSVAIASFSIHIVYEK